MMGDIFPYKGVFLSMRLPYRFYFAATAGLLFLAYAIYFEEPSCTPFMPTSVINAEIMNIWLITSALGPYLKLYAVVSRLGRERRDGTILFYLTTRLTPPSDFSSFADGHSQDCFLFRMSGLYAVTRAPLRVLRRTCQKCMLAYMHCRKGTMSARRAS